MSTCFECDQPAHHVHHVVPRSLGGTRTVPLCETCHGTIHGKDFTDHGILTRKGLERAKEQGIKLGGRRPEIATEVEGRIGAMRAGGMGARAIAAQLTAEGVPTTKGGPWHPATVERVLRRLERS